MKFLGVIPARYDSTRFPGKPLAEINGKPMILHVVEGALKSKKLDKVIVATDDERIKKVVERSGYEAIQTRSDHQTGSDRVWEAASYFDHEVILSIQGDEPLIRGEVLDLLCKEFEGDEKFEMATLARNAVEDDLGNLNVAKLIVNYRNNAIYFSRLPIPHSRNKEMTRGNVPLVHIGIYAYKREFLEQYCRTSPADIELAESLEQLRALYLDAKIRVVQIKNHYSIGVDTPEDLIKVEGILKSTEGNKDA